MLSPSSSYNDFVGGAIWHATEASNLLQPGGDPADAAVAAAHAQAALALVAVSEFAQAQNG